METLTRDIIAYWSNRAAGYSKVNQEELGCEQKEKWLQAITKRIGHLQKDNCRILDVGTGPGFFAILLAEAGYQVTAVDFTKAMLIQAKHNAGEIVSRIDFKQMDAQNLTFEDNTFDVVITRNLTWNLGQPRKAYSEWIRILKKGGILLNFDANWYCYVSDDEKRKEYEADRRRTLENNVEDLYVGTDIEAMEEIARKLPLSSTLRPFWDKLVLEDLGASAVFAEEEIWQEVWSFEEIVNSKATPMFLIEAVK